MTEQDNQRQVMIAWSAGFFDGEGCVSLHLHTGPKVNKRRQYPSMQIILTQKVLEPLEKFKETFQLNEKINFNFRRDKLKSDPKRRPGYYRLTISGIRAANTLKEMLPFLTTKREIAEVAIELQDDILKYKNAPELAVGLNAEIYEHRMGLLAKAKWINTGRWIAAETKSSEAPPELCDSPICNDGKVAEVGRNAQPSIG